MLEKQHSEAHPWGLMPGQPQSLRAEPSRTRSSDSGHHRPGLRGNHTETQSGPRVNQKLPHPRTALATPPSPQTPQVRRPGVLGPCRSHFSSLDLASPFCVKSTGPSPETQQDSLKGVGGRVLANNRPQSPGSVDRWPGGPVPSSRHTALLTRCPSVRASQSWLSASITRTDRKLAL